MRLSLLTALLAAGPLSAQDPPALDPSVAWVTSGGSWQAGARHGHYRLVFRTGVGRRAAVRLAIEWIEDGSEGRAASVRESRAVAVIDEAWTLGQPQFLPDPRRVRVRVTGTDPQGRQAMWTLTLGPPGQFSVSPGDGGPPEAPRSTPRPVVHRTPG